MITCVAFAVAMASAGVPGGLSCDAIHAESQASWNGSVIESVDTTVGPGSELNFQSTRYFDQEQHYITYDVDVTEDGVIITLDASAISFWGGGDPIDLPSVLPNEIDIVLSDLDFDCGPIGDVSVVQDGYQVVDPDTGDAIGGVEVSSDDHSITIHFPFLFGNGYEWGIPAGTHVVQLEVAPAEPGLIGDEIHAEGQASWNGSVIESVDTTVGPGSELNFQSTRHFDSEIHSIAYDVDVTEDGVIITLDASGIGFWGGPYDLPSVLPNEIDIVLSDLDFGCGPIGDVSVVQDGYHVIDPETGDLIGGVEVSSDDHGITIHFPFLFGNGYEWGIPAGTHVVELEIAPDANDEMIVELVDPVAEGWVAHGYDASALDTFRVYATFDEPVSVIGVGDTDADCVLLGTTVSNGQLYNDAMGSDLPPSTSLTGIYPSLLWDTFVTIGEPVGLGTGGACLTALSPDFATQASGLTGDFWLEGTGWYVSGFPAHADTVDNRMLIAQFTVGQGEQVTGTNWRISYNIGGEGGTTHEVYADFVTPDPCPMDLDGSNAVAFGDLTQLLGRWGACDGCTEDADGDGLVGFSDLTALLSAWGACP